MVTRFHNSYAQKVDHQFGLLGEEHDFPRNRHSNQIKTDARVLDGVLAAQRLHVLRFQKIRLHIRDGSPWLGSPKFRVGQYHIFAPKAPADMNLYVLDGNPAHNDVQNVARDQLLGWENSRLKKDRKTLQKNERRGLQPVRMCVCVCVCIHV